MIDLLSSSPWALASFAAMLGLIIGSFLNVVIYRLPIMMETEWRDECRLLLNDESPDESRAPFNLVLPRSRCPSCGHEISAFENVPVISYILLGGRCKGCKARISARYPLVEAVCGVATVVVALRFGATAAGLLAAVLTWSLLTLALIDFDTQLLPDSITLPVLWLGLLCNYFEVFTTLENAVIGAMAGYLLLWAVYWGFKLATGKEGMGYGDFKLLALLGAWFGWQAVPMIVVLSSAVGAIVGIGLIVFRSHDRATPIPFGPYLAAAGWIALLWGDRLSGQFLFSSGSL